MDVSKIQPKNIGPKSKLSGRKEFLMHQDLANSFSIPKTSVSRIFSTWVKTTAAVLQSLVFVPKMENIVVSRPNKFSNYSRLHSTADATEIFLQTPKTHAAQRITWSN